MVYIWAVEALGKGPSEPKTTEVCALFDVCCEKYLLKGGTTGDGGHLNALDGPRVP